MQTPSEVLHAMPPGLHALLCSTQASLAKSSPVEAKHRLSMFNSCMNGIQTPEPNLDEASCDLDSRPKPAVRAFKLPGFGDVVDDLWHFCSVGRGPLPEHRFQRTFHNSRSQSQARLRLKQARRITNMDLDTALPQRHSSLNIREVSIDDSSEYTSIMHYNVLNIFRQLSKSTPRLWWTY